MKKFWKIVMGAAVTLNFITLIVVIFVYPSIELEIRAMLWLILLTVMWEKTINRDVKLIIDERTALSN